MTAERDFFDRQGAKWPAVLGEGWETSPSFLVLSNDDRKAAAALSRAALRFYDIDEFGRELPRDQREAEEQAATTWDIPYTPNFISDVYVTPRGPMVWTDTNGDLPRAMGDAMLRVLLDELRAEGITAHVVGAPGDVSLDGLPVIPLSG